MYRISAESRFSAAHRLNGYEGNCKRIHGHNWTVRAQIETAVLDDRGLAFDFRDLSAHLNDIIDQFDHQLLNDIPPFDSVNPSSENIAKYIYDALKKRLPDHIRLVYVETSESDKYSAMYSED